MSDRPSDGFTFDELREEYDWMSDFMGRMAERIRGNTDVHSLAAYVAKLEADNAKLRELVEDMLDCIQIRAAFGRPPTEEMYEMFYKRARELGVDE